MLVIARQVNEKIIAENELTGDRMEITLVAIRNGGTQVRIGIDAPEHIRLTRAEVAQDDFGGQSSMKHSENLIQRLARDLNTSDTYDFQRGFSWEDLPEVTQIYYCEQAEYLLDHYHITPRAESTEGENESPAHVQ